MSYAFTQIFIERLVVVGTGTYAQQFSHPLTLSINHKNADRIVDTLGRSRQVTASTVSDFASTVLKANPQAGRAVEIENGWNEQRLRFFMALVAVDANHDRTHCNISGYTNYVGLSRGKHFADDMVFHISSINTLRERQHITPTNQVTAMEHLDTSHVISNPNYQASYRDSQGIWGNRVEDMYTAIDDIELSDGLSGEVFTQDTRGIVSRQPKLSRRNEAVASNYLANAFNGFVKSLRGSEHGSMGEVFEDARNQAKNKSAIDDPFLGWLREVNGPNNSSFFTYGDLVKLDPNVDNVKHISELGLTKRAGNVSAEDSAHWDSADLITEAAVTISQSLPGYMADAKLSMIEFTATNLTVDEQTIIHAANYNSFLNHLNLERDIDRLKLRLIEDFFFGLTLQNTIKFKLRMRCDLLGDTILDIQWGSPEERTYITPSFCDSLLTPLITTDKNVVYDNARDLRNIFHEINDAQERFGGVATDAPRVYGGTDYDSGLSRHQEPITLDTGLFNLKKSF